MIILVTSREPVSSGGMLGDLYVSEAYDEVTLRRIVVPPVHPSELGAVEDGSRGEWVLYEEDERDGVN